MSAGYEALAAKVKAMNGKRLRAADYVRMAGMSGVDEVHADLRQHPVWGPAVHRLSGESRFGRARLEAARQSVYYQPLLRLRTPTGNPPEYTAMETALRGGVPGPRAGPHPEALRGGRPTPRSSGAPRWKT